MKTKSRLILAGYAALVVVVVAIGGMLYLSHPNDLGLTGSDASLVGPPQMEALRANTRTAAEAFLARHKNDLAAPSDGVNDLAVDYSKSSKIRALGYRSSFYYYCWDIYLPYSLRTQSGKAVTVLVHLSDDTPGHGHDPQQF